MSMGNTSKVISIQIPAIYFHRLGYLAYRIGALPSEVARQAVLTYLNLGCAVCGGPIADADIGGSDLGVCVNPYCPFHCEGRENLVPIEDFSDVVAKDDLPGFSG